MSEDGDYGENYEDYDDDVNMDYIDLKRHKQNPFEEMFEEHHQPLQQQQQQQQPLPLPLPLPLPQQPVQNEVVMYRPAYLKTEEVSFYNLLGLMMSIHESAAEGSSLSILFSANIQRNVQFNF